MSFFVIFEILRLFVNTLTENDKYSLHNMRTYGNQFKLYYLQNKMHFLNFLIHFLIQQQILDILK